jgi:hypothetical protein
MTSKYGHKPRHGAGTRVLRNLSYRYLIVFGLDRQTTPRSTSDGVLHIYLQLAGCFHSKRTCCVQVVPHQVAELIDLPRVAPAKRPASFHRLQLVKAPSRLIQWHLQMPPGIDNQIDLRRSRRWNNAWESSQMHVDSEERRVCLIRDGRAVYEFSFASLRICLNSFSSSQGLTIALAA